MNRNRYIYALTICLTIGAGLLSRKASSLLPSFLNLYLGDALWAFMIYQMVGFLWPQKTMRSVGTISLLFCYAIEVSQRYHAPWIDSIRHTTLGGLILGFGFLWSDIVAYSAGIACGASLEYLLTKCRKKR